MFKETQRQAMYVWLYSMKWKKKLQHYGTIYYTSPKMKYVMLYVNSTRAPEVRKELLSKKFVKRISMAHRKELDEHFEMKVSSKDTEKEEK